MMLTQMFMGISLVVTFPLYFLFKLIGMVTYLIYISFNEGWNDIKNL